MYAFDRQWAVNLWCFFVEKRVKKEHRDYGDRFISSGCVCLCTWKHMNLSGHMINLPRRRYALESIFDASELLLLLHGDGTEYSWGDGSTQRPTGRTLESIAYLNDHSAILYRRNWIFIREWTCHLNWVDFENYAFLSGQAATTDTRPHPNIVWTFQENGNQDKSFRAIQILSIS